MKLLQVLGLVLAIVALILLAYYGVSAIPAAFVAALIVMLTNQIDIWKGFSEFFMGRVAGAAGGSGWYYIIPGQEVAAGVAGSGTTNVATLVTNGSNSGFISFFYNYFLIFASSTLFAKLYEDSGAASSLALTLTDVFGVKATGAILAYILINVILTWGGVSLFVVIFAVYPMVLILGKQTNMPKKIFLGASMIGSATITMTCLPASPQLTNVIPTKFFNTTLNAAPVLGIISGLAIAGLGYLYMVWEAKKCAAKGEGFVPGPKDDMTKIQNIDRTKLPKWWLTIIPIVAVLLINFILPTVLREHDTAGTAYYLGRWDATKTVVISMLVAALLTLVIFWKRLPKKLATINAGFLQAAPACANVAAVVGFGAVVIATGGIAVAGYTPQYAAYMADTGNATLAATYNALSTAVFRATGYTNGGFAEFIRFVYNLDIPAYFKAFVGIELLAGVVGSSSGGLSIGLPVLKGAGVFGGLQMVNGVSTWVYPAGTTADTFHRLTAIAAGGLDTLPHTGGIFLVLGVYQLTHKDAYKYIFVTSVLLPVIVAFVGTWLAVVFKF